MFEIGEIVGSNNDWQINVRYEIMDKYATPEGWVYSVKVIDADFKETYTGVKECKLRKL